MQIWALEALREARRLRCPALKLRSSVFADSEPWRAWFGPFGMLGPRSPRASLGEVIHFGRRGSGQHEVVVS
eukprot:755490-Alexandrium_andersonii.AAC.1